MWQEESTVHAELVSQISPVPKTRPKQDSLTDQILKFCASGQFGVREAIAAAQIDQIEKMDKEKMKGHNAQTQEKEAAEL